MACRTVLFVCVHNAGRSQMAAAYLESMSESNLEVLSAGSAPASEVNPVVIEAMAEDGIDLTTAHPKVLETENVRCSDVVITMGCGDACPVFPGKLYLDWKVDDPAHQPIEEIRLIRDNIKSRVEELVAQLAADDAQTGSTPPRVRLGS